MINLSQRTEPYELELPYGPTATVKPLTTAGMAAAQAAARPKKPTPELKQMWRELYDKEPPGFSRSYLISRLAYRITKREVTVLLAESPPSGTSCSRPSRRGSSSSWSSGSTSRTLHSK